MLFSSELSSTRESYSLFSSHVNFGRICLGLVAIAVLLPIPKLQAQIVDWTNTTGVPEPWYDDSANWSGGTAPTAIQTARFNQETNYSVYWDEITTTNTPSVGFLDIQQGDVTFLNQNGNVQHLFTINGSGGSGSFSDFSVSGAETKLTSRGLHLRSQGGGQILNGATLTLDGSHQYGSKLTVAGSIGFDVSGNLNVQSGAIFENSAGNIGRLAGSTGKAAVTGSGSQWNNSSFLDIGSQGNGTLNVQAGGVVGNTNGYIGFSAGSTGKVTVTGRGSKWNNSGDLYVGYSGNGDLNIAVGLVSNTNGAIGLNAGSIGKVTVNGFGSEWNNSSFLDVGNRGNGQLDVQAGGLVSNTTGSIGVNSGSTGKVTVNGFGSEWNSSGGLFLGGTNSTNGGLGTLNIQNGGRVNVGSDRRNAATAALTISDNGNKGNLMVRNGSVITNSGWSIIGMSSGSSGTATVTGSGSQWNNSSFLDIGESGNGTLNVQAGGVVSNTSSIIAFVPGATGKVTVTGSGSQWNNSSFLEIGQSGNGELNVLAGGAVSNTRGSIGFGGGSTGKVTVTGSGSQWNSSGGLFLGGTNSANGGMGTLNIQDSGKVNVGNDRFSGQSAALTVSDSGTNGQLWVRNGSVITNSGIGFIGLRSGSSGTATVTGSGSQWNNSSFLDVGRVGDGTLNVQTGGVVSNTAGFISRFAGSTGKVTVTGNGSQWNNSLFLHVGSFGKGELNVQAGGVVSNTFGNIGLSSGSTGKVTVTGSGSKWTNSGNLSIGGSEISSGGTGTLTIADSGLVTVGGTTRIWSGSNVNLTGGRFQFGQTTLQEFATINAVSGSMTGDVTHSGYTDVSTLSSFQNAAVDLTGVRVANSGTIYGNGSLGVGLRNDAGGEVETMAGERLRFAGTGSTNAGEINNFGGQIRFEQSLVNQVGGLISGRGQFFANGGWTNSGVIAMSGGLADVHGDLVNNAGGKIAIGGGSITTFYDDVTMDASNLNMDIASNSYGVFFGSYNGGFNGLGTVQAFGDLRPGNSPGVVSFGGDLELGENTATYIELGGLLSGEFDQLLIGDDFLLDGILNVSLIDDFQLGFNQEFLIADISGTRTGFFDGLSEGDLVGNFRGQDLFISYGAGNGNDISLFTAVPEPGAVGLLGFLMLGMVTRRNRKRV